jgi:SAM-dependent methyltransferase
MSSGPKLHLGAFDQAIDGWINTDVTPHLVLARIPGLPRLLHWSGRLSDERYRAYRDGRFARLRYLDLRRRFPFGDGTIAAIYTSHTFEHLHVDTAERALAECHRVLAPGGVLRIVVPNLDDIVGHYDPADPDAFLDGIFQGRRARDNRHARHWWHYNAGSLSRRLAAVGFAEVTECAFREGRCPDLNVLEQRRWSLFLEAVKS